MNDTLIVWGRYWYETLTITWVMMFFVCEVFLLFRNSLVGWAMTAKCLVLGGERFYVLTHPPRVLPTPDASFETTLIRVAVIATLGFVIAVLAYMRWKRLTVIVGTQGNSKINGDRFFPIADFVRSERHD